MTPQGFCPVHGPYTGTACPYPPPHSEGDQWRPPAPTPLAEDLPTDLGASYSPGEVPLPMPDEPNENEAVSDALQTRSRRKILDEDEDETVLGRSAGGDVTQLERSPRTTLCMLWVTEGPRRGRFYPIHHGTTIGRKEGDLILDDPKVSGCHAKFTVERERFFLWDLASSNGTYVNGNKIRKATLLAENDIIKIGDMLFVVKLLEPGPKRKAAAPVKNSKPPRSKNP